MRSIAAATLGCKVNFYETESTLFAFRQNGWEIVDFGEKADVYLINTCAVTQTAERKGRALIARAKRQNPAAIIAVAGCYSQLFAEDIAGIDGVDVIIGANSHNDIITHIDNFTGEKIISVTPAKETRVFEPLSAIDMGERTRAFLKIQDGCDNRCAYCAVCLARGSARSRTLAGVREEAAKLAGAGYREIVISGIHIGSYGKDLGGATLIDAIRAVCETPGVERVRLSSIDPACVTEAFVSETAAIKGVCPHFHLSLQSGCDKTLSAMGRGYTAEAYLNAANLLRGAYTNVSITTDVIAGFPGETEEDFFASCAFIEKCGLSKLHVFPFSPRKGTLAATMADQIAASEKKKRAAKLLALSEKLWDKFLISQKGENARVLIESAEGGFTENYAPVRLSSKSRRTKIGDIVPVRIIGKDEYAMVAQNLDEHCNNNED